MNKGSGASRTHGKGVLRILTACLAVSIIAAVIAAFVWPGVIREQLQDWETHRLSSKLANLEGAAPEKVEKYQHLLLTALDQKGSIEGAKPLHRAMNLAKALAILGRANTLRQNTVENLMSHLNFDVRSRSPGTTVNNRAIIFVLGRIGPGADSALPDLLKLPQNAPGISEAIQRVSGELPPEYSVPIGGNSGAGGAPEKSKKLRGWIGRMSKIEKEQVRSIGSQDAWAHMWREHAGSAAAPQVDFTKHALLAYFHGGSGSAMDPKLRELGRSKLLTTAVIEVGYSDEISSFRDFPFLMVEIPRPDAPVMVKKLWWQAMGIPGGEDEKVLARLTLK